MRNRGKQRTSAFVEPALRTPRSLCTPAVLVSGHTARCPRLDTGSFRHLSTAAKPPARRGGPCTPPGHPPWTRLIRSAFHALHTVDPIQIRHQLRQPHRRQQPHPEPRFLQPRPILQRRQRQRLNVEDVPATARRTTTSTSSAHPSFTSSTIDDRSTTPAPAGPGTATPSAPPPQSPRRPRSADWPRSTSRTTAKMTQAGCPSCPERRSETDNRQSPHQAESPRHIVADHLGHDGDQHREQDERRRKRRRRCCLARRVRW